MVDFANKLKNKKIDTVTDPIEIYTNLDRQTSKAGLLRPSQKFFNGKTIFNDNYLPTIDTLIIDDAHSSIETIRQSFTLNIRKNEDTQLFQDMISLFEDSLESQGEGTFNDMMNAPQNSYNFSILPVPYWAWIDKKAEVINLISKRINVSDNKLVFPWEALKDILSKCNCIVSRDTIEISPVKNPIDFYKGFVNAEHRIFMSATTSSDTVLMNDLNIDKNAVSNPLIDPDETYTGEKMIILPSLISDELDRSTIVKEFGRMLNTNFGITVITPSYYKTKDWESYGSTIATKDNIDVILNEFSNKSFKKPMVLVNRYDGIDLPDQQTRILILDSLPSASTLYDRYLEQIIPSESEIILKRAQKIEQGIGRSVRSEKDYSVILLIGPDLTKFIRSPHFENFFSQQTKNQINMGVDFSIDAKKDSTNYLSNLYGLINKSLERDTAWKTYYNEQMQNSVYENILPDNNLIESIVLKRSILDMVMDPQVNLQVFSEKIKEYIDNYADTEELKGYYFQLKARVYYDFKKSESQEYQKLAYKKNKKLLLLENINPTVKISQLRSEKRIENIILELKNYKTFENLNNTVSEILSNLAFNTQSQKFENALDELGKLLGFITDRPDSNYKKGPDHLWSVSDDLFFVIEDKSAVSENRIKINKHETGQMNNSIAWFEKNYSQAKHEDFLIIPTDYPDQAGGFNTDVRIIKKNHLKALRTNFKNFIHEFHNKNFYSLSSTEINKYLDIHHLNIIDFTQIYSNKYKK